MFFETRKKNKQNKLSFSNGIFFNATFNNVFPCNLVAYIKIHSLSVIRLLVIVVNVHILNEKDEIILKLSHLIINYWKILKIPNKPEM